MGSAAVARWWAPEAPGIGPDETDLFLLTPGDDGPKDLGQALLALHRVGAAACEAVATQPLADESVLCQVLATARGMVAPPAVQAVSKAVNDGPYGGLLVRDVLDDAEAAALSLWRTCIAKHVTPTLAAQRVGKVYGVPLRELGRYTMLASEPKTTVVVLDDAADRVLFDYVFKVVKEEGVEHKVEFSKAPAAEQSRPRTVVNGVDLDALLNPKDKPWEDELRDAKGQWATSTGPQEVAQQTEQPRINRTRVNRQTIRRQKIVRNKVVAVADTPQARAKIANQKIGPQKIGAQKIGAQKIVLNPAQRTLMGQLNAIEEPKFEAASSMVGIPRDVPDMLAKREDRNARFNERLFEPLAYVMPAEEWGSFRSSMAALSPEDRGSAVMRAGALEEWAGGSPHVFESFDEDDEIFDNPDHQHAVENVASDLLKRVGSSIAKPVIHDMASTEFLGLSDGQVRAKLQLAKITMVEDLGLHPSESAFVTPALDREDPNSLLLVYTPAGQRRLPVTVVEVVIDADGDIQGVNHAHEANPQYTVSPNQPLVAKGQQANLFETFYQRTEDGGYFRRVVHLRGGDEHNIEQAYKQQSRRNRFGKASAEAERFRIRESQGLVRRDADGEFARVDIQALFDAAEAKQAPRINRNRVNRQAIRRTSTQSVAQQLLGSAEIGAQKIGSTKIGAQKIEAQKIERQKLAELIEKQPNQQSTYLDSSFDYAVLNPEELNTLARENGVSLEAMHAGEPEISLGMYSHRTLKDKVLDSREATYQLLAEQDVDWLAQPLVGESQWNPVAGNSTFTISSEQDMVDAAYAVHDYLLANPSAGMLRMVHRVVDGKDEVAISTNRVHMTPQHLIRYEDGLSSGALTLTPENQSRLISYASLKSWLTDRLSLLHGNHKEGFRSSDYFPVPLVQTWSATSRNRT